MYYTEITNLVLKLTIIKSPPLPSLPFTSSSLHSLLFPSLLSPERLICCLQNNDDILTADGRSALKWVVSASASNTELPRVGGTEMFPRYSVYSPAADGHCVFASIAHQLGRPASVETVAEIRRELVTFIQATDAVSVSEPYYFSCFIYF